jgi:hypothetical protein
MLTPTALPAATSSPVWRAIDVATWLPASGTMLGVIKSGVRRANSAGPA